MSALLDSTRSHGCNACLGATSVANYPINRRRKIWDGYTFLRHLIESRLQGM